MGSDNYAAPMRPPAPDARPFTELRHLDEAWACNSACARLDTVTADAPALRDAIADSGVVRAVRTFETARFPYPTRFAFAEACVIPAPYVFLQNRAVLIEYVHEGQRRRLLANPAWTEGARKAPYFHDLTKNLPSIVERLLADERAPLPQQLRAMGIAPESIDFITFDHLHVQEVGPMLGPLGQFPNAKLLVTSAERDAATRLHPLQRYWYVDGTLDAVEPDRIVTFDRDILLGEGLALVRTPGHTDGNHTIVFALADGLITISENGVAVDSYAPRRSRIPGLRAYAERSGAEVVLNANSRERTCDQYTSMCLERILAEPVDGIGWPRHFPSSELLSSKLAPGIHPTFAWTAVNRGVLG